MRVTPLVATLRWVLVACVFAACVRTVTAAGSAGTSRTVLTSEQLAGTNSSNVYDAIATLHPDWLSSRGPSSVGFFHRALSGLVGLRPPRPFL